MKSFTIFSSETVIHRTEIKANSHDEALDMFYNNHVRQGNLIADSYENFGVDNVEESKSVPKKPVK
jgi:hypothetical protein